MNLTKILNRSSFICQSLSGLSAIPQCTRHHRRPRIYISLTETAIIEKLKLIREAEIVFQSVNGRYTANWDSLIILLKTVRCLLFKEREEITQKSYGVEEVTGVC
ncbi:MAG: hypothetical protein U5K54_27490 [Cytophagales bacterium]|nr:hypothetical protein [Cytophagales bacterium]